MKPGINHGISEADYHGFSAVSKSQLWAFAKNPHKWAALRGQERASTPAMDWGSLVDCLILQPGELSKCFAVSPHAEFRTDVAKAWKAAQTGTVIKAAELAEAEKAAAIVREHHFARMMLDGAMTQVSAVASGKESGTGERFLGKCRMDIVPSLSGPFGDWLVDLKTTSSLSNLERTISDFGYHVQAAWYLDMWNAASGQDRKRWGFVFQESDAPYEIAVVELDQDAIARGREWYLNALEAWCLCHKTNNFPSPFDDEIRVISLPKWA